MPEDQKLCPFRMIGRTTDNIPRMACKKEQCEWWYAEGAQSSVKGCIIPLKLSSMADNLGEISHRLFNIEAKLK